MARQIMSMLSTRQRDVSSFCEFFDTFWGTCRMQRHISVAAYQSNRLAPETTRDASPTVFGLVEDHLGLRQFIGHQFSHPTISKHIFRTRFLIRAIREIRGRTLNAPLVSNRAWRA